MKNLIMLFLVIAGASVFVVFWDSPPEIFLRSATESAPEELPRASSYMKETVTRKFEMDGSLAYVLHSEEGRYYQGAENFVLDNPSLVARPASGEPWHFSSRKVRSAKAGEEIIMSGNVYAWQPLENGKNEFRTSVLSYFPETNQARTRRMVIFTSPSGNTTARGMKADFDDQVYHLLEDVKGNHYGQ